MNTTIDNFMLNYLHQLNQKFMCSFELLPGWSIIKISGLDNQKYLNNYTTIDIFKLPYQKHILCANCNSSGRVNGVLRLFYDKINYFYIQRSSIRDLQISSLIQYAVFSKIKIEVLKNYLFLGLVGIKSKEILLSYFSNIPNNENSVIFFQDIIILWFDKPIERFLLILKKEFFLGLKNFLLDHQIPLIKNRWLFLDIKSGIPILEKPAFQKFFPQDLNVDCLGGIDFYKGCYCGQEMISKIHFRNINNKKLYCLIGETTIKIDIFSVIELYDQGVWRNIGKVLFSVCIIHHTVLIQCILKNIITHNNKFRLASDHSSYFFILNSKI